MADSDWPGHSPQPRGESGGPADPSSPPPSQPLYPYGAPPTPYPYPYGQPGMPPSYPPYPGEGTGPVLGGDAPTVQPGYPPVQDPSLPPYPYPGAPSQPLYPYGQPGAPSQPLYPGSPSQPLYPYGQPTAPSQPLYPYGGYAPPSQYPSTATGPRRSYRGLLIGVVVAVVVLALLGTGAFVGISQYQAPAQAAEQFCTSLKAQDYVAAYNMFSSSLQSAYSSDQFTQGSQLLDKVEGTVTSCGAASGSAYDYTLFGSTATISAVIDRAQSGALQGKLRLVNQNGWKIAGIDTSLLGVNLTSLQAVGSFCTALQNGDYAGAYADLGSTLQSQVSASTFAQDGALHQQIDGAITACTITAFGQGNSDSSTSLTVSISRSTLGTVSGQASLDVEGGAWKISSLDTALEGSDLGGLFVVQKFCSYLKTDQPNKAFGLLTSSYQAAITVSLFDQALGVAGISYNCSLQLPTYKVTDPTDAHITGAISLSGPGGSDSIPTEFCTVQQTTTWKVNNLQTPGQAC